MSEIKTTMEVRVINADTGEVISSRTANGDTASAAFKVSEFIAHGIDNVEVECLIKEVKWATGSVKYSEDQ